MAREQGTNDDPVNDIANMQAFGDNQNVLSCLEALHGDHWLCVVTIWSPWKPKVHGMDKKGPPMGPPPRPTVTEAEARSIFVQSPLLS